MNMEEKPRKYILTERAHLMCPNMCFGILAKINAQYHEGRACEALKKIQKAHPFLESLILQENDQFYYQVSDSVEMPILIGETSENWAGDYEEMTRDGWDVTKECLLKVVIYPKDFQVMLIAHHLLCDGRGLLQLAQEYADYYVNGQEPQFVAEKLIGGLEDLPQGSDLPFISKIIINDANKKWTKAGDRVDYAAYREFEKSFIGRNPIKRDMAVVQTQEYEDMVRKCKENGVSVNDYLIAKMMIDEDTGKVVIAADIRKQLKNYQEGAMGNYSTAFSVNVKRNDDIMVLSKQVSAQVADIMSKPAKEMLVLACYIQMLPELIDAVAISTLGDFRSEAGRFVGANMFGYARRNGYCITNLGKLESNSILEAAFIPPASPANIVTWGVLTVNDVMKISTVRG